MAPKKKSTQSPKKSTQSPKNPTQSPKKSTQSPKKATQSPKESLVRRSPRLSGGGEPPKKKQKATPKAKDTTPKAKGTTPKAKGTTIIVEHCRQCNSFKTRAMQVKNGLEEAVEGVKVVLNPENPRKGCFEIRPEEGEPFVCLLDMKRPFTPMKELIMEDVISDIVQKIK